MGRPAFTMDLATAEQVADHLRELGPTLRFPGDPLDYAHKLLANSVRFEAWDGARLAGLVAVYCNEPAQGFAFITHVGVLPQCRRLGVAGHLLEGTLAHAARAGFREVRLEVEPDNAAALELYGKFRFRPQDPNAAILTLTLRFDTGA